MENGQIKVKRKSVYWFTIIVFLFLVLFLSYQVYVDSSLIFRVIFLGADLFLLFNALNFIANTIRVISINDESITIHRLLLKDIIVNKDNLLSISNKHIRVISKVLNISYIANNVTLLKGLVRLLTDQDFDKAFNEINNGVVIYKSRDILQEIEKKRNKETNITYIVIIAVYGFLFLFLAGGFIINMFSSHWSLSQAIAGVLFWIFAFVLTIFDKSKKSNNGIYIVFKLVLSVILCIIIAFVITKVFLLIGIDLNKLRL